MQVWKDTVHVYWYCRSWKFNFKRLFPRLKQPRGKKNSKRGEAAVHLPRALQQLAFHRNVQD